MCFKNLLYPWDNAGVTGGFWTSVRQKGPDAGGGESREWFRGCTSGLRNPVLENQAQISVISLGKAQKSSLKYHSFRLGLYFKVFSIYEIFKQLDKLNCRAWM